MMKLVSTGWAVIICLLILAGCSGGQSPVSNELRESKQPEVSTGADSHNMLGFYTFTVDPSTGSVDVVSLRDAVLHLNALKFLEPPPNVNLTIEGQPQFNGNILDIDIGLRHPQPWDVLFTAFDVCGIVFTHGSVSGFNDPGLIMAGEGDTRLLNADGYTRWWNPAEFPHGDTIFGYKDGMLGTPADQADFNSTLNGYKYFASDLEPDEPLTDLELADRGMIIVSHKAVRHYQIDLSGGLIFNYAVDANWKHPVGDYPWWYPDDFPPGANRPEAYNITLNDVIKNSLYFDESTGEAGGEFRLLIDVWDHFDAGENKLRGESLAGLPQSTASVPMGSGEGYATYELEFSGDALTQNGDAELLLTVESNAVGYAGVLPGKPVSAYFKLPYTIEASVVEPNEGWARTWGGICDNDEAFTMAIDAEENIYVGGEFRSRDWPCDVAVDFDPGPGEDLHNTNTTISTSDAFLSKFNSSGIFLWARTWGGQDNDITRGIAIDELGNIYANGIFTDTVDFDPGPGVDEHTSNGLWDLFLSKFDSDGNFLWAVTWGGESFEDTWARSFPFFGMVYVTGQFDSPIDFDPGPGTEIIIPSGTNAYLSCFDSSGSFQWVQTWGTEAAPAWGRSIARDSAGNTFVLGEFLWDTLDFDPGSGVDEQTSSGLSDITLSKFNPDGDYLWVKTWGGVDRDHAFGLYVDSVTDAVYVSGSFNETVDFDPGLGVDEHVALIASDSFLSKFDTDGNFIWVRTWGGGNNDSEAFKVTADSVGNVFVTGYFEGSIPVDMDPSTWSDWHMSKGGPDAYVSKFTSDGDFLWCRSWGGISVDKGRDIVTDSYGNCYVTGAFSKDYYDYTPPIDFDPTPSTDYHSSLGLRDCYLLKILPNGYW